MRQHELSVVYCGNEKVFPMVLLSVLSVLRNTPSPLHVYLVTMDKTELDADFRPMTERQREVLQEIVCAERGGSVRLLRVDELYERRLSGGKNEVSYYTPYAQIRLLTDELPLPDKVLYLDIDVMCKANLLQLFDIDVENYEFAAVRDHMGKHFYGRNYFNSGVMLFNMKRVRETGLFARCCQMVKTKKLMFSDQDALNKCGKSKLILPRRFNEQRGIRADTVLKHFCRGIKWLPFFHVYNIKQTERDKVRKKLHITEFDDIYRQYDEIAATCDIGLK